MKKSQNELMHVLKNADKWLTAFELAERVGISPIQVRRLIATAAFKDVAKGIFDTERPHGGRYVAVYRLIPKQKGKADQALELAKRHQGVWGQLMWINQPKIELVERT